MIQRIIICFHFPCYLVEKKFCKLLSSNDIHVLSEFICQKEAKQARDQVKYKYDCNIKDL